jgi:uncharacterized protein YraI
LIKRRISVLSIFIAVSLACNLPAIGPAATDPAAPPILPSATTAAATAGPAPTSGVPLASPSGGAVNCRTGPGTNFPVAVLINPGQAAEIVGHNSDGSWWYVKNPAVPGALCWMSAEFTLTSGDVSGVPLAAEPPTPAAPPTAAAGSVVVTNVTVSISPEDISVGGCMGPIQPSTITATISVSGPIKLTWHFVTDQNGALPIHSLNFNKAGDKDVSATFTPPVEEGTYDVWIVIDGMDLGGMDTGASYEISC